MENIKLDKDDFGILAICAIRYCQGRRTYMSSLIIGLLINRLNEFNNSDLAVMIDDCEYQERMKLFGQDEIDKPAWMKWKNALLEEQDRRLNVESKNEIC